MFELYDTVVGGVAGVAEVSRYGVVPYRRRRLDENELERELPNGNTCLSMAKQSCSAECPTSERDMTCRGVSTLFAIWTAASK